MKANGRGNGAVTLSRRSPPPGHGAAGLLTLSTFSRGHERNYQHISSEKTPPQNTNTEGVLSRARAHSEEISPRQGYTQPASAKGGRGLSWGAAGGGGWGRGDSGPPAARGWPGQVLAGLRGRRCAVYGVVKTLCLPFLPSARASHRFVRLKLPAAGSVCGAYLAST